MSTGWKYNRYVVVHVGHQILLNSDIVALQNTNPVIFFPRNDQCDNHLVRFFRYEVRWYNVLIILKAEITIIVCSLVAVLVMHPAEGGLSALPMAVRRGKQENKDGKREGLIVFLCERVE